MTLPKLTLLLIKTTCFGFVMCVLAGIILTALKGMLKQICDLPTYWRHSRCDGFIWVVTFLSVVLLDIDIGLGIGIIASLATIIMMGQKPYVQLLGNLPGTDVYLETDRYHMAVPVPNVIIINICGGLHFANKNHMQSKIEKLLKKELKEQDYSKINKLVIDMSAVIFIDPASAKTLLSLQQDLTPHRISLLLAKCSVHVCEQLKQCEFFNKFPESQLFPSVHDAVLFSGQGETSTMVIQHALL